jgi:hypothetical protein
MRERMSSGKVWVVLVAAEEVEEARDPTAPIAGIAAGAVAGPDLRLVWLRVFTILRVCFWDCFGGGLAIRLEEVEARLRRCRERSVGGMV